ncbi:MAG: DUF4386 family protein [Chloroflexi bacterium]|nr:DUF4386 family protein [Chloroflexota bacterium]
MFFGMGTSRIAGLSLLLLAAALILTIAFSFGVTDANVFERDEVEEFLTDINGNEALFVLATALSIAVDAVIGLAAGAALYVLFRDRSRILALFGFAFILANGIAFLASDASNFVMLKLAEDFVEKGGPAGIGAGDAVILEVARAVGIFGAMTAQVSFTALSAGLITFGVIIAWAPAGAVTPPWPFGWLAVASGILGLFTWLITVTDGAFGLIIAHALLTLAWLILLGPWLLLRAPEEPEAMPARATAG